jgi:hypothetical protein
MLRFLMVTSLLFINLLLFGCDDTEQRYVTKRVPTGTLVGAWKLKGGMSPQRAKHAAQTGTLIPWETIKLKRNGELVVQNPLVNSFRHVETVQLPSAPLPGSWQSTMDNPFYGRRPNKAAMVRGSVSFSRGSSHNFSLNIMKRDDEYVLWQYAGDPDAQEFQEYVRHNE